MINRKVLPSLIVLAVVCGLSVLVPSGVAQIPTVKGQGKLLEVKRFNGEPPVDVIIKVYTVPEKRTLVITDIVVSSLAAGQEALVRLQTTIDSLPALVNQKTSRIKVPADGTLVIDLGTGIEYGPGEQVFLATENGAVSYLISGYERKAK